MTASFDGALVPAAFEARSRTKYVPAGTPDVENVVAVLPVLKFATLLEPPADPASST